MFIHRVEQDQYNDYENQKTIWMRCFIQRPYLCWFYMVVVLPIAILLGVALFTAFIICPLSCLLGWM